MNTSTILNNYNDMTLSTAELFYNRYKKYMRDYRQLNPKKMSESCKRYTNKLKSDPVTNALMLEKRKNIITMLQLLEKNFYKNVANKSFVIKYIIINLFNYKIYLNKKYVQNIYI